VILSALSSRRHNSSRPYEFQSFCSLCWHVRFGSEADMCVAKSDVRLTPESGHRGAVLVERRPRRKAAGMFVGTPGRNSTNFVGEFSISEPGVVHKYRPIIGPTPTRYASEGTDRNADASSIPLAGSSGLSGRLHLIRLSGQLSAFWELLAHHRIKCEPASPSPPECLASRLGGDRDCAVPISFFWERFPNAALPVRKCVLCK
jgi:hypothetical protein